MADQNDSNKPNDQSKQNAPASPSGEKLVTDKATGAVLQTQAEIDASNAGKLSSVDVRPVRAGHYVVAGHTSVRSLDMTFKPGDDFMGAVGDIPGLVKSGALVPADD